MIISSRSTLLVCSRRVVYVGGVGEPRTRGLLDLAGLAVEGWRPVRDFYAWPRQRTFQGWWWFDTEDVMAVTWIVRVTTVRNRVDSVTARRAIALSGGVDAGQEHRGVCSQAHEP